MAKWDWTGFKWGKGQPKPTATEGRTITQQVFARQKQVCIAHGISPVCTYRPEDPHELIGRGAGGRKSLTNSVGICRACHNVAQGKVGGNALLPDWPGKAEGAEPRADVLGFVTWRWVGKRKGLHSGAHLGNASNDKNRGTVPAGQPATGANATTTAQTERLSPQSARLAGRGATERGGDRDTNDGKRRRHERNSKAAGA